MKNARWSFHTTSKTSKLMRGRPSRRPNASAPFGSSASAWSCIEILGRTAFGSPNSTYLSNPKNGHQTNRTINDIILRILRFLAESSGVTKLELFQLFPHCKWGFSSFTDSARLRQDSATNNINFASPAFLRNLLG